MVTTAGSLALKCDIHGKYVHVLVSVTCFLSSTYCFGHTCNVSADKVEVTFISCRTRNRAESMEVKLPLVYSSVTYLPLLTNILTSTDLRFKIQINFGQICFTVQQIWTEWSRKSQISKPPVEGLQDSEKVQSSSWSCFMLKNPTRN
jgi:hypothetical protein